ncbi:hypothetical protein Ae201684_017269 [Aphanomyces euteiches]|uniref:Uncharacterized protein n=1 Tax=Aphanomyces euteiches TaxID=100861 RepID=A0A6G0W9M7_9STRA|nr:hypothetical protein Ae201684_017269 [Aphanomyces euteiches]
MPSTKEFLDGPSTITNRGFFLLGPSNVIFYSYRVHRASGTLALLTSGAAVIYGLYSGCGRANSGPQGQLIAIVLVGLLHITTVTYLHSSKNQTTKAGFSTVGFHRGLDK